MEGNLTNREFAIIVWSVIAAGGALLMPAVRGSAIDFLRILFGRQLLTFFLLLALYTSGVVYVLVQVGVWGPQFPKIILLWFLFTACASASRALSGFETPSLWAPVKDAVKFAVLIEIILASATFPLVVELALVPGFFTIGVVIAVAQHHSESPPVEDLLARFQVALGLVVVVAALRLRATYTSDLPLSVFWEFVLPPMLSVAFIPAVFATVVYTRYNWLFNKLHGDAAFRRYARWRLLQTLKLKPERILLFGRAVAFELPSIRNREEFAALMERTEIHR